MQFLAKSLSKSRRPSTARQSWILSQQCPYSSRTVKSEKTEPVTPVNTSEWPRPTEVPYQQEMENSVNFIGYVNKPVEFNAQLDGKSLADTVISHASGDSPTNFGLKKGERIQINGKFSPDFIPSGVNNGQANVCVLVSDFHHILGSKALHQVLPEPDVEAPHQVLPPSKPEEATVQKTSDWRDYREKKQNGSVNSKFPDFKKKDGSESLWLNRAPHHILPNLKDLKFDTPVTPTYAKEEKGGEESWKDLVQNKQNWWDNRVGKTNPKGPDFVHKQTRAALWLNTCPSSLLTDLPPPKSK